MKTNISTSFKKGAGLFCHTDQEQRVLSKSEGRLSLQCQTMRKTFSRQVMHIDNIARQRAVLMRGFDGADTHCC